MKFYREYLNENTKVSLLSALLFLIFVRHINEFTIIVIVN